jgi:acetylornithine/LysW-gamma-L-lysine aminotransferase
MGAFAIGKRVGTIHKGTHSSTFGGNPLACATALVVLDIMQKQQLPEHAATVGAYFLNRLRAMKNSQIREVRGLGLMVGVELKEKVAPYLRALMEHGVIALAAGATVLRFLPPLIITPEEIDIVVTQLTEVLQA